MNAKWTLIAVIVILFVMGCSQSAPSQYQNYNQPQGQPQQGGQYVGGGCGVAPSADYKEPIQALDSAL